MWVLRYGSPMLLRQKGALDTGSVLWGRSDLSGGRGAAGPVPGVWESEAREAELAFEQSLLHEALWNLCGSEVSHHDRKGCGQRVEIGLAHGESFGPGVYGEAA